VSDIFREVDEEVRKEQFEKLWKKYGYLVIAVAVAIVIGVGGYQAWVAYRTQQREAASQRFYKVSQVLAGKDVKTDAAIAAVGKLADPGGDGYGMLAAFEQANLLAGKGDTAGAVKIWDQIADKGTDGAMRRVATILAVQHQLDSGDPDALTARLKPLIDKSNEFRPLALELSAALALRKKDIKTAKNLLQQVADDAEAPRGARTRATQVLATLSE
jgi:hypothetical protein